MAFVLKVSNKRQSKQREFCTYYLDQYFLEIVVVGNFSRQNVRVEVSDNFFAECRSQKVIRLCCIICIINLNFAIGRSEHLVLQITDPDHIFVLFICKLSLRIYF